MAATARRMRRGARTITTGKQLRGQLTGPGTHVGPNALLRSSSYPAPFSTPPGSSQGTNGPLFVPAAPTPAGSDSWRIDPGGTQNDAGSNGLCTQWAGGSSQAYVYNNHPSNTGGIVGSDMKIDGWPVPAGTLVFQFMDFSYGSIGIFALDGGPDIVFRGCRARAGWGDTGLCNGFGGTSQKIWFLYCDVGGSGLDYTSTLAAVCLTSYSPAVVYYRNYLSYMDSGIFPYYSSSTSADVYENYIEKITAYPGKHLNGISLNGGQTCCRIKRNHIVIARSDENSVEITDTDCIAFFDDFNGPNFYTGAGTNPDGTTGYQVVGNYMGGTGYCAYTAAIGYDPSNAYWVNNLITTSSYPIGDTSGSPPASGAGGGFNGPFYTSAAPPWGSAGNFKSNNIWADGPDRGSTWL